MDNPVSSATTAQPVAEQEPEDRSRCMWPCCKRKLNPAQQQMACKCTKVFCGRHRPPTAHGCTFDDHRAAKEKLHKDLPKIASDGFGTTTRI